MPTYQSQFEIRATATQVWQVLTALDRYSEWNPQIPQASGTVGVGSRIALRLALPGKSPMDLVATFEDVQPGALLTWRGHLLAPWFFEGYRRFEIRPAGDGAVSVTHVEDVHGLFAPVFGLLMGRAVQQSHTALNEALRARAQGAA